MIVDLPNTTTSLVSKKIMALREQGGVIALGRVLTLVVVTKSGLEEEAIEAANDASREHPSPHHRFGERGRTPGRAGKHPQHLQSRRHRPRLDPPDQLAHPTRRSAGPGRS